VRHDAVGVNEGGRVGVEDAAQSGGEPRRAPELAGVDLAVHVHQAAVVEGEVPRRQHDHKSTLPGSYPFFARISGATYAGGPPSSYRPRSTVPATASESDDGMVPVAAAS
jgi:hypothetical protein